MKQNVLVFVLWSQKSFPSQVDWSSHIFSWYGPCLSLSATLSQPTDGISVMLLETVVRSAQGWLASCVRCKWGEKPQLLTRQSLVNCQPSLWYSLPAHKSWGRTCAVSSSAGPAIQAWGFSTLWCGPLIRRRSPAADDTP